jgi:hypothetical protein
LRRQFFFSSFFYFVLFYSLVHLHRPNLRWLMISSFSPIKKCQRQNKRFFFYHAWWRDRLYIQVDWFGYLSGGRGKLHRTFAPCLLFSIRGKKLNPFFSFKRNHYHSD